MTNPITPPPELVQQWLCSDDYPCGPLEQTSITITTNRLQNIAANAAQWGADQELLACGNYLKQCAQWEEEDVTEFYNYRRPGQPSLKEQALKALDDISIASFEQDAANIIRRALEALPK
jgi:hypothetical protein